MNRKEDSFHINFNKVIKFLKTKPFYLSYFRCHPDMLISPKENVRYALNDPNVYKQSCRKLYKFKKNYEHYLRQPFRYSKGLDKLVANNEYPDDRYIGASPIVKIPCSVGYSYEHTKNAQCYCGKGHFNTLEKQQRFYGLLKKTEQGVKLGIVVEA